MAVGSDQRLGIRLAVKPEAITSLELQTSYTYSYIISINRLVLLILYIDIEAVEVWVVGCPEMHVLQCSLG